MDELLELLGVAALFECVVVYIVMLLSKVSILNSEMNLSLLQVNRSIFVQMHIRESKKDEITLKLHSRICKRIFIFTYRSFLRIFDVKSFFLCVTYSFALLIRNVSSKLRNFGRRYQVCFT